MKNILLAVMIVVGALGCAIDGEEENKAPEAPKVHEPPQAQGPEEERVAPPRVRPHVLPGVGHPDLTPTEDEIRRLIPDLTAHQFILRNEKIEDTLEIRIINPRGRERLGSADNPIRINRSAVSKYVVRIQTHPLERKLLIDRGTGERVKRREYPLRLEGTTEDGSTLFSADINTHKEFQDYGQEGGLELVGKGLGLELVENYTKAPLFQRMVKETPEYEVTFKDSKWKSKFRDERQVMLKQLRAEDPDGEQAELEKKMGITFAQMRRDLFSEFLSHPEVQNALREQGVRNLMAHEVWDISNYITIYANGEVADITDTISDF